MGTPTSFAPWERKELREPMKLGSSQRITSPSLHSTLQVKSIPCCPPEVMMVVSNSRPKLKRALFLPAIKVRKGVYPSVMPYCRAWEVTAGSAKIAAEISDISVVGKDSAAGLPAAKGITAGSVKDLKISRMAEGFNSFMRFDIR